HYIVWDAVVSKHSGDTCAAGRFAQKRRDQHLRNTGAETFLWYSEQERQVVTKRIDEVAAELGADPGTAMALMGHFGAHAVASQSAGAPLRVLDPPGSTPSPKPKAEAKKKQRKEKQAGSEMELHLPENGELALFIPAWIQSATAAQGQCAQLVAQLLGF
ncbi:unnamed protein product, partial [Effrenium voratum]